MTNSDKFDDIVTNARRQREERERGYRDQALKMYPWICGRCQREFTRANLSELTVHHRNHNHDDNPADGSNWELLCVYCHDNEHQRYLEYSGNGMTTESEQKSPHATHNPFSDLKKLMQNKK